MLHFQMLNLQAFILAENWKGRPLDCLINNRFTN